MDELIRRFDAVRDADLMLCEHRGVAYQRDMAKDRIRYDAAYLARFDSPAYTQSPAAMAVRAGRRELVARHLAKGASVLDVGAGAGLFVWDARGAGYDARGFDVMAPAADRLRAQGLYAEELGDFAAVTLWDSLEHMEDCGIVRKVRKGGLLFASLPVFEDLNAIRASKHYKPGEHLYYWTAAGFVAYMALRGFRLLESSDHETRAGREAIGAFAFIRDLPDRRDYITAYQEMHSTRHYGSSATELHLDTVTRLVRQLQPRSILDYGCGRSDLVAHFYLDGKRKLARYDPAIPMFRRLPEGSFDLVLACDVMEHIPMSAVDLVLSEIRAKSGTAIFTISTKLARAKLPDGSNAHCTLLTRSEWTRWIAEVFGPVEALPCTLEHELVLLAGNAQAAREAA